MNEGCIKVIGRRCIRDDYWSDIWKRNEDMLFRQDRWIPKKKIEYLVQPNSETNITVICLYFGSKSHEFLKKKGIINCECKVLNLKHDPVITCECVENLKLYEIRIPDDVAYLVDPSDNENVECYINGTNSLDHLVHELRYNPNFLVGGQERQAAEAHFKKLKK